jgi:predicted thioesterase
LPKNIQRHQYVVLPIDAPDFGDGALHPVLSTYALAREIEWTTRQFAIQLKGPDQEGIGTSITIKHKRPAKIGQTIEIEAECTLWDGKRLDCSYKVFSDQLLIAEGTTGQAILKKTDLDALFYQDN